MIVYTKGDQDYLLLNNSSRGVMKMKLNKQELDEIDAIESRVGGGGTAGIGYETLSQFENVSQLDKLNDELGVMLVASSDNQLNLQTFKLP